ncbi:hypothetical protein D3C73_1497210 [compost metagenome]
MIMDEAKKQAFAALGYDPEQAKLLGGYDSNVFGINRSGEEIVDSFEYRTVHFSSFGEVLLCCL